MMAQKPLMLKDYLELEWNSDSSGAGFRCAPRRADDDAATVRCLLEADLRGGGRRMLPPTRSMQALTKISAVFNAVRLLPFAAVAASSGSGRPTVQEGFPSRSLSKRLRESFWRRKGKEEENRVKVRDIVRLRSFEEEEVETGNEPRSFDFPSPVVSSCSSCSESDSVGSDFLPSSIASSDASDDISASATAGDVKMGSPLASPDRSPEGSSSVDEDAEDSAAGHRRAPKAKESQSKESPECYSEEEEKEQLSPVSVMDFPSEEEEEEEVEEEDDDTTSPSFHNSLANLERTKLLLLQKIRRFECLADLDPVDLDRRFASSDDLSESTDRVTSSDMEEEEEEEDERARRERKAWGLLGELNASCHVAPQGGIEKLLVDFFIQGLSRSGDDDDNVNLRRPSRWRSTIARHDPAEGPLLDAARGWIEGPGCWDLDDYHGEATLREMDRSGRWRSFEEEEEVGVELEDLVLGSLVEEMVADFASR